MTHVAITRVTHSCHLIEIGGKTILTDPWFTKKEHYDQGEPIAFTIDELPALDAVLITHAHYDHCDLDAFRSYRDLAVPLIVAPSVVDTARDAGFTDIRPVTPWESIDLNGVTVTGAPAAHAVAEVTFVIGDGTSNVYFAGDTLFIPELAELPDHVGPIDVALLPTNGLRIRAQFEMQVVMDHRQAAQLTALLRPKLTMPHHYAFTSDPVGDMTITRGEKNPQLFVDAVAELDPSLTVRVTEPRYQGRVVNTTDPGSGTHAQAVIAVLEAKPNCAEELAALVRRLTPHVRAEPGCLGFIPYRAQTNADRIYIYDVDADAFDTHLQADYVREFIAALPAVTTNGGRESAVQLDVLDGAAPETGT